jgi:hypothetical protein
MELAAAHKIKKLASPLALWGLSRTILAKEGLYEKDLLACPLLLVCIGTCGRLGLARPVEAIAKSRDLICERFIPIRNAF